MSDAYQTESIEIDGRAFIVSLHYDADHGAPWEEADGHGVIRTASAYYGKPDKKPGEVVMYSDRGTHWLYDVQATTQRARADGWGLGDAEKAKLAAKLGRAPTAREVTAEAVRRDMAHCRGWLRDDWHWCGIAVQIVGPDGEPEGNEYAHALWGVESCGDYWREVAEELAGELLSEKREAWRAALKEARARKYWACRDVVTA